MGAVDDAGVPGPASSDCRAKVPVDAVAVPEADAARLAAVMTPPVTRKVVVPGCEREVAESGLVVPSGEGECTSEETAVERREDAWALGTTCANTAFWAVDTLIAC